MPPKGTAIKDAIKKFEEKTGEKAAEATHVKLWFQDPPIERLDGALKQLSNCEKLSLSTNNIERISSLHGLDKLKVLSLSRNCIKKIEGLDAVSSTLEELWVSYNLIERLQPVTVCKKLRVLYAGNCNISSLAEIDKIKDVGIEEIALRGNPFCADMSDAEYRAAVLKIIPGLKKIDGRPVTGEESADAQ